MRRSIVNGFLADEVLSSETSSVFRFKAVVSILQVIPIFPSLGLFLPVFQNSAPGFSSKSLFPAGFDGPNSLPSGMKLALFGTLSTNSRDPR